MKAPQGNAPSRRKSAGRADRQASPQSPGFDKKLDGPNRPST